MTTDNLRKRSYQVLQDYLIEFNDIPERLEGYDVVLKKELLEHLEIRINKSFSTINGLLLANPNYNYNFQNPFEYWANNVRQIFTYPELKYLRDLVQKSIEIVPKNPTDDIYPFKDAKYQTGFNEYRKLITDTYIDYSYLFQRLLSLKYIHKMKHFEFMDWLYSTGHIKEFEYNDLKIKGNFRTLKKCSTLQREQNFNVTFKL